MQTTTLVEEILVSYDAKRNNMFIVSLKKRNILL